MSIGQWKGLEEFMAVVEAGSFSKAAERIGVTVSHVSKRVTELEKHLNVQLLERTTRTVNPTTPGKLFYQACRKLLAEFNQACDSIHMDKEALTGQLKLCYVGGSRPAFQMSLYRSFLDKYPSLNMEVTYSDHIPNLTREGLDLALVIGEVDNTSTNADPSFHLCWIDYVLVAAPTLFETLPLPTAPADCAALPCILNGEDHWRLCNGDTSVKIAVSGRFSSTNMPACIDACLAGMGVFMVPAYSADSMINDGRLIRLLPDWYVRQSMHALIPSNEYVPVKVILLMEFMEQFIGTDAGVASQLRETLMKKTSAPIEILRELNEGARQADAKLTQSRSV